MSDQKLRDLERRWKETGSPDDEAAYLLERVRVGDLSQERLELAAYCGHEGAKLAGPFEQASARTPVDALVRTIGERFGKYFAVRASLAALAASSQGWQASERARAAVDAALAWRDCPCQEHSDKAAKLDLYIDDVPSDQWHAVFSTFRLAEAVAEAAILRSIDLACESVRDMLRAESPDLFLSSPPAPERVELIRHALLAAMVDWALATLVA